MSGTHRSLGERLAEARRRAFAGRGAELELFVQALESAGPTWSVLHVHGPGGIGKSTLLDRLADEASARGVRCVRVDARTIRPIASDLLRALGVAALDELVQQDERLAIFVDTYEELSALDDWLRDALLPALPEHALLVLAGREPPRPAWRADPGVADLLRVRALRNLSAEESGALLGARGVATALFASAHALTHGHPLALALVSELALERPIDALPALTPDIVRTLLDRILRAIPEPERRAALEVAALARVVDEPLLASLGEAPPGPVYAWLRALSFVHESGEGVALHDLVRDAIAADLAVRNPERHQFLHESLAARTTRALASATGRARERAFYDALFGLRRDPTMGRFYDWERGSGGMARPMREPELGPLLEEIARHEGDACAAIARHWWARQPEAFHALLDPSGTYVGTLVYLRVAAFDADDCRRDPALARASEIVRDAPLREGEIVKVLRFWIWRDRYQDVGSAAHAPHSMVVALDWAAAALAWCVLVVQRVDAWRPFFAGIRFAERPEAAFAIGEHRFTMFARDFRTHPWSGADGAREGDATKHRPPPRIVLSQEDFGSAVRDALRLAIRPAELSSSPLLSSRLLADWAEDEAASPEMIRELLEIATSSLDDERAQDDRPRRCVELTYLRPAPTQELAAERLGLSFSTYRRQLARGVERVIAYLWEREVRGLPRE